jgi:hypothetical protein
MRKFLLLYLTACTSSAPPGVAYLRISESAGPCPATQPLSNVPRPCPSDHYDCAVDKFTTLPFVRAQATAAVEPSTRWSGGNLIALGWQRDDGVIGQLQLEVGTNRGYGLSDFPYPSPIAEADRNGGFFAAEMAPPEGVQQAIGYVEWKDGARVFAATSVTSGVMNYGGIDPGTSDSVQTNVAFFHIAFDGVNANNIAACRVVAAHIELDYPRFKEFDPTWLDPLPGAMLDDDPTKWPPTFADVTAPTDNVVAPTAAPPDPGGKAPVLSTTPSKFYYGTQSGGFGPSYVYAGDDACD